MESCVLEHLVSLDIGVAKRIISDNPPVRPYSEALGTSDPYKMVRILLELGIKEDKIKLTSDMVRDEGTLPLIKYLSNLGFIFEFDQRNQRSVDEMLNILIKKMK